jgi:hypothetical protein
MLTIVNWVLNMVPLICIYCNKTFPSYSELRGFICSDCNLIQEKWEIKLREMGITKKTKRRNEKRKRF